MDGSQVNKLIDALAVELGYPPWVVRKVVYAFLERVAQELAQTGAFHLKGLGKLLVRQSVMTKPQTLTTGTLKKGERSGTITVKPQTKVHVDFRKSTALKKLLSTKYGRKP